MMNKMEYKQKEQIQIKWEQTVDFLSKIRYLYLQTLTFNWALQY